MMPQGVRGRDDKVQLQTLMFPVPFPESVKKINICTKLFRTTCLKKAWQLVQICNMLLSHSSGIIPKLAVNYKYFQSKEKIKN